MSIGIDHPDSEFVKRKIKIRDGWKFEAKAKFNKTGKFIGWNIFLNNEPAGYINKNNLQNEWSADEAIQYWMDKKIQETFKK